VSGELFVHEVRKDGKTVVVLRGVQEGDGRVTVNAEAYAAGAAAPHLERPFSFDSPELAHRFVTEALTSLEYLDCEVTE
jgi:hypothetical protein